MPCPQPPRGAAHAPQVTNLKLSTAAAKPQYTRGILGRNASKSFPQLWESAQKVTVANCKPPELKQLRASRFASQKLS